MSMTLNLARMFLHRGISGVDARECLLLALTESGHSRSPDQFRAQSNKLTDHSNRNEALFDLISLYLDILGNESVRWHCTSLS